MRVVVLVSGAGSNAVALVERVRSGALPLDIVAVGADRPCEGLERARHVGCQTFLVDFHTFDRREDWDAALLAQVRCYAPHYVLMLGFMRVLGPEFVETYAGRIINIHPSLLPAFPGAHAVTDALAYGVKVTGCTVMLADAGLDTGPILAQAVVTVRDDDDSQSLHERIKEQERQLLPRVLAQLADSSPTGVDGHSISSEPTGAPDGH